MRRLSRTVVSLVTVLLILFLYTVPVLAQPYDCGNGFSVIDPKYCPPSSQVTQFSTRGINIAYLRSYSDLILYGINSLAIPIIFAVAFLMFVWGAYKYFILGADDEKARTKGRQFVLYAVLGFVAIISVWGLVTVVINTFNLGAGGPAPSYPTL